jgi:hypothetical protein
VKEYSPPQNINHAINTIQNLILPQSVYNESIDETSLGGLGGAYHGEASHCIDDQLDNRIDLAQLTASGVPPPESPNSRLRNAKRIDMPPPSPFGSSNYGPYGGPALKPKFGLDRWSAIGSESERSLLDSPIKGTGSDFGVFLDMGTGPSMSMVGYKTSSPSSGGSQIMSDRWSGKYIYIHPFR